MFNGSKLFRAFATLSALAVSATLMGCATVKRDEFNAELATIRGEMHDGDEGVERRLGRRVDNVEAQMTTFRAEIEGALETLQSDFDMKLERFQTALRFNAPVFFEHDIDAVAMGDEAALAEFATVVSQFFPGALITVEGFTDQSGTRAYNQKLGQRRADSVKGFLVDQGLAPERIRSVSYGEDTRRLVTHGAADRESASVNRRVVLVIDHSNSTSAQQSVTVANKSN